MSMKSTEAAPSNFGHKSSSELVCGDWQGPLTESGDALYLSDDCFYSRELANLKTRVCDDLASGHGQEAK